MQRTALIGSLVAAEHFFFSLTCGCHASCCPVVMPGRSYEDRLDTISNVREAGISVCCGGILGLGEVSEDGDEEEPGAVFLSSASSRVTYARLLA